MPKIAVVVMLLLILGSLGSALFYMVRGGSPKSMAKALTWRVGLSAGLFIMLIVFYKLGWIAPHGLERIAP